MIIRFDDLQKQKDYKEKIVMQFLINYYKDMADSSGVDIPYFVKARNTYNELIHNMKDLNISYKKIMEFKKCQKIASQK